MQRLGSNFPLGMSANVSSIRDLSSASSTFSSGKSQLHFSEISMPYKKRKIDRACDNCRRRKIKCDGPDITDNVCTNCTQNRKTCTYVEASKPRGPPKSYVTGLEDRLERMEALLQKLLPDLDISSEVGPPIIRGSWKNEQISPVVSARPALPVPTLNRGRSLSALTSYSQPQLTHSASMNFNHPNHETAKYPSLPISRSSHLSLNRRPRARSRAYTAPGEISLHTMPLDEYSSSECSSISENEALGISSLEGDMKRVTLRGIQSTGDGLYMNNSYTRFHGKSSLMKEIVATRKLRQQHMEEAITVARPSFQRESGSDCSNERVSRNVTEPQVTRRAEFWSTPQWELEWEGLQGHTTALLQDIMAQFPPPDLAYNLLELYFAHTNSQYPLLHRPTFEQQWREGLQHRDLWFACLCLLLFAVGSRWSDDPRVLADKIPRATGWDTGEWHWHRAGWHYFQVAVDVLHVRRSLLHPPCIHEVQSFSLIGMFWRGSLAPTMDWVFVSIGLQKALDAGAHQKRVYQEKPSIEEESWKRAFWLLVCFDRMASIRLGRPICISEEDFDLDLPLEVDDDYWETDDPIMAFKQPPSKPSLVTAFNLWIKLTQMSAFAMRTIYAIKRPRVCLDVPLQRWKEGVVSQLSTAMTEWFDSIPPHLRWPNCMEDNVFANQSTTLYTNYYLLQILVYRPFIPPPLLGGSLNQARSAMRFDSPFPAQTICVNAAKSCARIINTQMRRGFSNVPNLIGVAQVCTAVLLANLWELRGKQREQQAKLVEDVKPPLSFTIDALTSDILIFIDALEWAAIRWENASEVLKDLKNALPPSENDVAQDSPNQPVTVQMHATHNRTGVPADTHLPPDPPSRITEGFSIQSQNADSWPWYPGASEPLPPDYQPTYNPSSSSRVTYGNNSDRSPLLPHVSKSSERRTTKHGPISIPLNIETQSPPQHGQSSFASRLLSESEIPLISVTRRSSRSGQSGPDVPETFPSNTQHAGNPEQPYNLQFCQGGTGMSVRSTWNESEEW